MSTTELLEKAIRLPASQRAKLALHLIDSLDEAPWSILCEVDATWEAEIRRRLDSPRDGTAKTYSVEEGLKIAFGDARPDV